MANTLTVIIHLLSWHFQQGNGWFSSLCLLWRLNYILSKTPPDCIKGHSFTCYFIFSSKFVCTPFWVCSFTRKKSSSSTHFHLCFFLEFLPAWRWKRGPSLRKGGFIRAVPGFQFQLCFRFHFPTNAYPWRQKMVAQVMRSSHQVMVQPLDTNNWQLHC